MGKTWRFGRVLSGKPVPEGQERPQMPAWWDGYLDRVTGRPEPKDTESVAYRTGWEYAGQVRARAWGS